VQLGAFAAADRAQALLARVRDELAAPRAQPLPADLAPRVEPDGGLHRVLLGALPDRDAALALAARLAAVLGAGTPMHVVTR
jgi:cell division septation protein DedD